MLQQVLEEHASGCVIWAECRVFVLHLCLQQNFGAYVYCIYLYYCYKQNVLDGDLCEQFNSIDATKQKSIADDLDRTSSEVSKKLEDIRTRYAF